MARNGYERVGADPREITRVPLRPAMATTSREADMPDNDRRPRKRGRREAANSVPYDVEYFAAKHDISREQARELIRRIGNDREKLNAAASKLFRK